MEDDPANATFQFSNEDHTLGNALRYVLMTKYGNGLSMSHVCVSPQVTFCGYSIPHPSENKMNIRLQTTGNEFAMVCLTLLGAPATETFRTGLRDLDAMCEHIIGVFEDKANEFERSAMQQ